METNAECVITTTNIATTNLGSAGSPAIRLTAATASADATATRMRVIVAGAAGCSITATFASSCCQMIAAKPAHGYDLIKALEDRMGGGYSPSPGVIYPTLTMLEE